MAATIPLRSIQVARTISGNSPQTLILPEAITQTFKKGELVYLNAGYVTICGANPNMILGVAGEDAHNGVANGTYNVAVIIANSDTVYEINLANNAGTTGLATAVTDIGGEFGVVNATNKWTALRSGAPRLMCLDLSNFDAVGDIGGRLLVQVIGRYRQLFCTS